MSKHSEQVKRAKNAMKITAKHLQAIDSTAYVEAAPDKGGIRTDDPLVYFRKTVAEACLGFLEAASVGLDTLAELEALRDAGSPEATIKARDYMMELTTSRAQRMGVDNPYARPPGRMH